MAQHNEEPVEQAACSTDVDTASRQKSHSEYTSSICLEHEFPPSASSFSQEVPADAPEESSTTTTVVSRLPPVTRASEDIKILKAFFKRHYAQTSAQHQELHTLSVEMDDYQDVIDSLLRDQSAIARQNQSLMRHLVGLTESVDELLNLITSALEKTQEKEGMREGLIRSSGCFGTPQREPLSGRKRKCDDESGRKVTCSIHSQGEKNGYSAASESEANETSRKCISEPWREWKQKHIKRRRLHRSHDSAMKLE